MKTTVRDRSTRDVQVEEFDKMYFHDVPNLPGTVAAKYSAGNLEATLYPDVRMTAYPTQLNVKKGTVVEVAFAGSGYGDVDISVVACVQPGAPDPSVLLESSRAVGTPVTPDTYRFSLHTVGMFMASADGTITFKLQLDWRGNGKFLISAGTLIARVIKG